LCRYPAGCLHEISSRAFLGPYSGNQNQRRMIRNEKDKTI